MLRRRSTVSLVVITAIAVVVATVAVVYALQTIFQTSGISAKVNIVTGGDRIRVCSDADTNCTTPFTGDLDFGNMLPGTSREASFHIKNVLTGELAAPVFVDARIGFFDPRTGDVVTPLKLDCCADGSFFLVGEASRLGLCLLEHATGDSPKNVNVGLEPGEVRRVDFTYTSDGRLPPCPVNFDILVDAVDVLD